MGQFRVPRATSKQDRKWQVCFDLAAWQVVAASAALLLGLLQHHMGTHWLHMGCTAAAGRMRPPPAAGTVPVAAAAAAVQ